MKSSSIRRVLTLLRNEYTDSDTARALGVTRRTISNYRSKSRASTGNVIELAELAKRRAEQLRREADNLEACAQDLQEEVAREVFGDRYGSE